MTLKSCLVLFSIKPMNDNAYKLTKKTAKRISGGRIRERAGFRILRKVSATPRNGSRASRKGFAASRNGSRTPQKGFAMARGPSELFGNASRHREMVPAHRGRAFLLNSLCPSGISPFKRGRKIEKQTIPAPPSEGGAPRRGEGVRNSAIPAPPSEGGAPRRGEGVRNSGAA